MEVVEALLVLISEEEMPSTIRGFRPLSPCNVSVKVISKMIVNRLEEMLSEIIYPNQASLIPERQSIDNIVTCQEIVHSLRYTKAKWGVGPGESL